MTRFKNRSDQALRNITEFDIYHRPNKPVVLSEPKQANSPLDIPMLVCSAFAMLMLAVVLAVFLGVHSILGIESNSMGHSDGWSGVGMGIFGLIGLLIKVAMHCVYVVLALISAAFAFFTAFTFSRAFTSVKKSL
jgi:hypothetical protein